MVVRASVRKRCKSPRCSVVLDAGKNDRLQYVIWASGSDGVILRSVDEGSTWKQISVPNAGGLDFRDIEAFSADEAYVMSSGEGNKSRVYKTTDGGKTWKLQYSGTTPGTLSGLYGLRFRDALRCFKRSGKWQVRRLEYKRWGALVGAAQRQNASGACQRRCVCGERDCDCDVRSWRNLFRDRWASSASLSFARSRPVMDSLRDTDRQRHGLQRYF